MRDEKYILDLCDAVLCREGKRQHRFPFLCGDSGRMLPVDSYYPDLKLVIEYQERQHSEVVAFFDCRKTVSGVPRGRQRSIYDQRRNDVLPLHGIHLVIFSYAEFMHGKNKRIKRNEREDLRVIRNKLVNYCRDY